MTSGSASIGSEADASSKTSSSFFPSSSSISRRTSSGVAASGSDFSSTISLSASASWRFCSMTSMTSFCFSSQLARISSIFIWPVTCFWSCGSFIASFTSPVGIVAVDVSNWFSLNFWTNFWLGVIGPPGFWSYFSCCKGVKGLYFIFSSMAWYTYFPSLNQRIRSSHSSRHSVIIPASSYNFASSYAHFSIYSAFLNSSSTSICCVIGAFCAFRIL